MKKFTLILLAAMGMLVATSSQSMAGPSVHIGVSVGGPGYYYGPGYYNPYYPPYYGYYGPRIYYPHHHYYSYPVRYYGGYHRWH